MFKHTINIANECLCHLLTVKVEKGDINISDCAIGAVAGPGGHVGTATVNTHSHPPSKDEGML